MQFNGRSQMLRLLVSIPWQHWVLILLVTSLSKFFGLIGLMLLVLLASRSDRR